MRRPGVALTRFELLEHGWDGEYENRSNVVDVHVKALRDRIDRPFETDSLETVRGRSRRCDRRPRPITDSPDRRLPVPPVDDEIGRLGATLNAMLARLEHARAAEQEAVAKERRFVADASHELRTPLTILKSEIDVALAAERPGSKRRIACP